MQKLRVHFFLFHLILHCNYASFFSVCLLPPHLVASFDASFFFFLLPRCCYCCWVFRCCLTVHFPALFFFLFIYAKLYCRASLCSCRVYSAIPPRRPLDEGTRLLLHHPFLQTAAVPLPCSVERGACWGIEVVLEYHQTGKERTAWR